MRSGGGPVTFSEFVEHIIDPRRRRPLDRHWRPYHQLCQPCHVRYDFIGHYETLVSDSRYVLRRLGIRDARLPRPTAGHNSSDHVVEMFSQLTQTQLRRLVDVFRLDFELFGYSANVSQEARTRSDHGSQTFAKHGAATRRTQRT